MFVKCALVLLFATVALSAPVIPSPVTDAEASYFVKYFKRNIDYNGRGAIMASPSTSNPDYFYDWVRDAGITMTVAPYWNNTSYDPTNVNTTLISVYADWVLKVQNQNSPNGIDIRGEPKFYMDGRVYDKPWGRPQNDGPALRAIVMIQYALDLVKAGQSSFVLLNYYNIKLDQCCGIKYDLEYIAHNWMNPSFDVWEEINGDHFFTRIIQRRALLLGSRLANALGDYEAARYYDRQQSAIAYNLNTFWNAKTNNIMVTLNRQGGFDKLDGLDFAVVLGALYGGEPTEGAFSYWDDRVLATAARLEAFFKSSASGFTINARDDNSTELSGTMFGRYPGDEYDGYETGKLGNPWILCTCAMADLIYRNAAGFARMADKGENLVIKAIAADFYANIADRKLPVTSPNAMRSLIFRLKADADAAKRDGRPLDDIKSLVIKAENLKELAAAAIKAGDDYIRRVRRHVSGYNLYEQFNRDTGMSQGARDLTWSYGTLLSALGTRKTAESRL